jgi:hypothetical protein
MYLKEAWNAGGLKAGGRRAYALAIAASFTPWPRWKPGKPSGYFLASQPNWQPSHEAAEETQMAG